MRFSHIITAYYVQNQKNIKIKAELIRKIDNGDSFKLVMALSDQAFQSKCIGHLEEVRSRGGTIIMASHGAAMLRRLCSRAIWLEGGAIRMDGDVDEVLGAYQASPPNSEAKQVPMPVEARSQ